MSLNPIADIGSALTIGAGCLLVGLVTGYVGGCTHQKDTQAEQKLREVKESARLEKQDGANGVNAVAKLRAEENKIEANTAAVIAKAEGKPLVIIKSQPAKNCPAPIAMQETAQCDKETKGAQVNAKAESGATVVFDSDAISLYDLSFSKYAPVRARAIEKTAEVSVAGSFRESILVNNGQCAEIAAQLDSLIDRIEEKQRLFPKTKE